MIFDELRDIEIISVVISFLRKKTIMKRRRGLQLKILDIDLSSPEIQFHRVQNKCIIFSVSCIDDPSWYMKFHDITKYVSKDDLLFLIWSFSASLMMKMTFSSIRFSSSLLFFLKKIRKVMFS